MLIAAGFLLFGGLYFGFNTKPAKFKTVEKQRQLASVSTDVNSLLADSKANLDAEDRTSVQLLENEVSSALIDSAKVALLMRLSSLWYSLERPAIAGHYAEKVAEIKKDEDAWSIAGTTYSICVEKEKEEKVRSFCTQRAIQSLENAASLNPSNLQHKVNLALVQAENPPADNPMKGILMLIELNEKYPNNPLILTQLGRLAIKTGQFQKAVERLEQALTIEPNNQKAICLMVQAYEGLGNKVNAQEFQSKCDNLSGR